jgi:DNA-binding beta-propeller fold protein YncE
MKRLAIALVPALLLPMAPRAGAQAPAAKELKAHKIKVGGDGGWDYLTADPEGKRLYVSRGDRVIVIDTAAEKVVGEVADTPGVHGIAVVPELNRGFTSNGRDNSVTVFDLKTLKPIGERIKVGTNPDAILYDPASKRVYTFNHGPDRNATAIDPSAMAVAGSVPLDGTPEAGIGDGKGHVFVNIQDKGEVVEFDGKTLKILNRYSLAPGQRPSGIGYDPETKRIFSICSNQKMMILNAEDGKVVAEVPIGRGTDGGGYDPGNGNAYSSNGQDGTLSVVRQTSPGKYAVVATVPTQASARTMTLDPKTHRVYLSAAEFGPAPAEPAKGDQPKGARFRRPIVPGSFCIIVVE